jgi:hypothetical protein
MMIRQGDVLLKKVSSIPEGAKHEETKIVAYGEATGHHHKLVGVAEVYSLEDQLFATIGEGVQIVHQEHAPLAVEEGIYEIRIQREYTPQGVRQVMD